MFRVAAYAVVTGVQNIKALVNRTVREDPGRPVCRTTDVRPVLSVIAP